MTTKVKLIAAGVITPSELTLTTASAGTNTVTPATTAFVQQELTSGLAPKAPIASPTFTGTPSAPTAAGSTTTTQLATTAFVQQELTTLIGGAPSTLNDLNELAAAINDDADYNSTLTTALATKLPLAGGTMSGALIIGGGGSLQLQPTDSSDTDAWILYQYTDDTLRYNFTGAGADEIIIKHPGSTNATTLTIDTENQRLGIGTGTPASLLHLSSGSYPKVTLTDTTGADRSFSVGTNSETFTIRNETASADAFTIDSANNAHFNSLLSIPSKIKHTGDDDTYIEFNGADQFRIVTGNVERVAFYNTETHFNDGGTDVDFIVESSGNSDMLVVKGDTNRVGVGTFTPDHPLEVVGAISSADTGVQKATFANVGNDLVLTANAGQTNVSSAIILKTSQSGGSATERMRLHSNGNVGIGPSAPAYKLALESTATGLTHNLRLNKGSNGGDYAEIAFQLWNGSGTGLNTFGGSGTSRPSVVLRAVNEATNSAAGAFVVGTFTGGSSNSTLTEKFRVASGGNVGIGTTLPNSRLMVIDTTDARKQIEFSNHATYRGSIGHDAGSGFNEYRTEADGGKHAFYRGATSTTPEMVIDNNGKVGIGTAVPASLLDVGGGLIADPVVRIDSAAGGDPSLVFDTGAANRGASIKFHDNGSTAAGFINYVHNGDKMNFGSGSTTGVTMTVNDGKVGIGTTAPTLPLDIMPDSSKKVFGSQQNSTQHGFCEYIISGTIGANAVTITMQCPSYFQAEVVATFQQSNGGTDMNAYYNGIWSNNHTTHLFKNKTDGGTVAKIGGYLNQSPTYSVGVGDAASNSGKLIFTKPAAANTSGTYCIRVIAYGYSNAYMTYVVS